MQLVVVADIFGKTPELEALVARISTKLTNTLLLDPYGGDLKAFVTEQEAYSYFDNNIGLDHYTEIVLEKIKHSNTQSLLIGFSIGASVLWRISRESVFRADTRAIGFYGSQIRNFPKVNPVIEIDLYFPRHEPHFDVSDLIEEVSKKKFVRCFKTDYLHGFLNKRSENYDEVGCSEYLEFLKKEAERSV